MAPLQQGAKDRRLPPLGLYRLSRVAFQLRAPPPGGLPPLGLTGRTGVPCFSNGTTGFEHLPPPTTLPQWRVSLARSSRPLATNEAGSLNWSASVGGAGTGSGGGAGIATSTFVVFSFGGGSNESLGFTFSAAGGASIEGTGGHNGQDMMKGDNTIGSAIGYQGIGYNPNLSHADEYPPSQELV
ncbi:hypothetical protein D1007_25851 [Hordeum vulgare]|nr:hypothetical protein D1007_25851 [Hordeum vulgare]